MNFNDVIWGWASSLPNWQSDLVRRLYEKSNLEAKENNEIFHNLLHEHGFTELVGNTNLLELEHIPNKARGNSVKITKLGNLQNVSAIDPKHGIEFSADGLTIIYGENSAGKSSYAKVLKQACRAVDSKTKIHPNIYQDNQSTSTADIHFIKQDGTEAKLTRKANTSPESILSSISIFDTDCARIYAQNDNEVVFIPSEFKIFDLIATHQTRLKQELQTQKDSYVAKKPDFNAVSEQTKVRTFLNTITHKTKKNEIHTHCTFTEQDQKRFDEIESDLKMLSTENPQRKVRELERIIMDVAALFEDLKNVEHELSRQNIGHLINTHQHYLDYKDTLEVLTKDAFTNQPLGKVGENPWKRLWEAAKHYHLDAYPAQAFPNTDDTARCVLCQQELSIEAKIRLQTFEEFMNDSISQEVQTRYQTRKTMINRIRTLPLERIKTAPFLNYLQDEGIELYTPLHNFIVSALKVQKFVLQAESNVPLSQELAPLLMECPIFEIEEFLSVKNGEVARLRSLLERNNIKELQEEQHELLAKKEIHNRIEDVHLCVKVCRDDFNFEKALKALDTTKITRKYNELSSVFLTDHFKTEIEKELKELRCNHISFDVNNKGVKGKTTIKLHLNSNAKVSLNEVLSEGEQKAISLAFFLAETSAIDNGGGIILDDPVSSLDHGRREYVARRLVQEAKQRQVIVFTHDIIFLYTLQNFAKRNAVQNICCNVRRIDRQAGIAGQELPWVAQKLKQRIGYLRNQIPALIRKRSELDPTIYHLEVKQWFMLLREAWERAVEEVLFKSVIQRFDATVKTQSLIGLEITEEMIQAVTEGMTVSSSMVHDEAMGYDRITPSIEEMELELQKLDSFYKKNKPK
ncbi:hypothetical protein ABE65_000910 [Fictibacillus phosphorivorans]|uniref:Protein CR006 P-loop domain-containing protein n=1 Tax=Fictibacillus phosphorivorans TaxID=1221500 RepID=A0A160IHU5_9BACL|nr:AAA family ATPase [Fictibacillus phosphorivorans]ANC75498.1 hypothetical protein ABE65_000910 [Fictibacillus phosphorivorans]